MPRPADDPTAAWFRRAAVELAPHSALHAEWASRWADDDELLGLADLLPRERRQPSLLFSCLDAAGLPVLDGWERLRPAIVAHWSEVAAIASRSRTQTNEIGRCAPLLLALQRVEGPIALLELGASAGLCLAVDRWSYRFEREEDGETVVLGSGAPELVCRISGAGPLPARLPEVVWRRGIDLAPMSAGDAADRRWLESLIPPDRPDRRARLRAALAAVQDDPPRVVEGDALGALAVTAADAPDDATLVVVSLGTAVYLAPDARAALLPAVRSLGARAVTLEAASAIPSIGTAAAGREAPHPSPFLLAIDGEPIAAVAPHGDRVSYLGERSAAT
jgi:hypothetical protein